MHRSKPVSVLEDNGKVAWCLRVKLCSQSGHSSVTAPIYDPGAGRPVRDPEARRFTGFGCSNHQRLVWPETGVILGLQKEHLMFLSHRRYRNHTINSENTMSDSKFTNIRGRRSTMGHIKVSRTRSLEHTLVIRTGHRPGRSVYHHRNYQQVK